MDPQKEPKTRTFLIGTWVVTAISVIYILIGVLLLMVPEANPVYLFYAIAIILLIFGLALVVRYLISSAYRNIGNYSFCVGVSCVVIGVCVLLKAFVLSDYLPLFLGVCILFGAMIKMQNAVDLRCADSKAWIVFLILAFVFVAAALIIILNPSSWVGQKPEGLYVILIADGAVGIVGTCYVAVSLKLFFKNESRRIRMEEEAKEREIEERASKKAEEAARLQVEMHDSDT